MGKISSRDKKLLIYVIGICLFLISYFVVYNNMKTKNDAIMQENVQLTERLNDLLMKQANEETYRSETVRMNEEVAEVVASFPSYLQAENGIMDVVNYEKTANAQVSALTLNDPALIEVVVSDGENVSPVAAQYYLYDIVNNMTFTSSYDGLKSFLTSVLTNNNAKNSISSMSATFDENEGTISTSLEYNSYYVFGQDKNYVGADIPAITHGTDDLFGTVNVPKNNKTEESEE